jgi:hypothetical protein
VFAALAVSRWIETTTGWSMKKYCPTVECQSQIQSQRWQFFGKRLATSHLESRM